MVYNVKNKEDFDAQLSKAGAKLVVVDFFATWCGPCKAISPLLEEMSKEMSNNVVFLKVDVDECKDVAEHYKIQCMPTFLFFQNGEKKGDPFTGANAPKLRETIQSLA